MRDGTERLITGITGKILAIVIFNLLFLFNNLIQAQPANWPPQSSTANKRTSTYVMPVAGALQGGPNRTSSILGEDYLIGSGDVLDIKVFDSEDLNRKVRVGGDGYISLPLIGSIIAGGLSVPDLEFNIAYEYSLKYLKDPQISVYVLEFHSKRVAVLGEVKNPQLLEMTRNKSNLLEMISLCGGVTKDAGDLIYIIRPTTQYNSVDNNRSTAQYNDGRNNGYGMEAYDSGGDEAGWEDEDYLRIRDEVITVSVSELVKYQNPLSNVEVLPGDMISIPPAPFYFVFGEVDKPGAFMLKQKMTALQAISQAGKFSNIAKNKIKLIREDIDTREKIITTLDIKKLAKGEDEDIKIMGGDVLLVGKSTMREVRGQLLAFSNTALSAFTSAYAYESVRDR
ncbi:MAG: polysaccharide biosynthesis/export family protein [Candidatus Scalindua rubra]|uniref:Exopolysaccharide biosynthesis protein n=1 Tax=Candidatus Scalindua brodae TaxID=237368 RepID=A0A0B0EL10_9BACT|nr:MAG: exopolysaccharide biosynthesis protein [Candidatus Scalindua brodae]MBZ0108345.1 polysaccharide biosynthesis/export family protein [Candidatus Scalindua rubra]TWU34043.1 Polysaccharide biosynthesis/export protein [Candidatus Brocadiaceae bacterium S225]